MLCCVTTDIKEQMAFTTEDPIVKVIHEGGHVMLLCISLHVVGEAL